MREWSDKAQSDCQTNTPEVRVSPDKQKKATDAMLEQAALMCDDWTVKSPGKMESEMGL